MPLTETARRLRRSQTDAEKMLWSHLRNGQAAYKFRRQQPLGPYIADFICHERKLVIEVDGGQHSPEKDHKRDTYLKENGLRILRFWNNDILQNIEGVMTKISEELNTPHPPASGGTPSPSRGEGLLPSYKAVLWDMDGTLVDSEPLHGASVKIVGEELGFPVRNELLQNALGVGHQHCFKMLQEHLHMPIRFENWLLKVEAAYLALTGKIEPRENAVEIVKSLHARGIPQVVFSNSPRPIVEANTLGFLRFFDNPADIFSHIISIDDVANPKPDPEGYFLAAQKLGLGTEECLVIEDSPTGVRSGKAAGCFTILWKHAEMSPQFPVDPDLTVDDLGALFL